MVDVVDEAHDDPAVVRAADRVPDDGRGLGAELEVVLRELERSLGSVEEGGDLRGDVDRGLAAVGQSMDRDGRVHRAAGRG